MKGSAAQWRLRAGTWQNHDLYLSNTTVDIVDLGQKVVASGVKVLEGEATTTSAAIATSLKLPTMKTPTCGWED